MTKPSKEEIKEKQEVTVSKMKKNRYKDTLFLRDVINDKLKWALAEKEKGLSTIEQHKNQIEAHEKQIDIIKGQVTQLNGAVIILKELSTMNRKKVEDKVKAEEAKLKKEKPENDSIEH